MDDAARICERVVVFDRGRVLMDGTPESVFSQPEKLISVGLSVPHASELAMALRERGIDIPRSVYTHESLVEAVLAAKGVGKC